MYCSFQRVHGSRKLLWGANFLEYICSKFSGAEQIHTDATKRLGGTVPAVWTPFAAATVTSIPSIALLLLA
jgi:hypothetical protein